MPEWITVKKASNILNVHDRTIRRYISEGKLKARKEGRHILIDIDTINDLDHTPDHIVDHGQDHIQMLKDQIQHQQTEIDFLRDRVKSLEDQTKQEKERDQMIILQLTRQLEQSQRMLEAHKEPFWKRWFRKRSDYNG